MKYQDIFGIASLLSQFAMYLYLFKEIKAIKWQYKFVILFIVMELLRGLFLGGAQSIFLVVGELYFISKKVLKEEEDAKSWFASLYAFFFGFTFSNFFNLFIQEFTSIDSFYKFYTLYWLISVLFTIASHKIIVSLIRLNVSALQDNDEYITDIIIKPLNKVLVVSVAVLGIVHHAELSLQYGTVSQYSKHLIFGYIFMIVSVLILLNNKIVGYHKEIFRREKEEQFQRLALYTTEIENLYQTVRGFKHDYKNMLITLRDSIDTGDIRNVKHLYQTILVSADISLSEGENIDDLSRLGSPALKSLLYHKFNQARQDGVVIHLEIKDGVSDVQMELLDFVRIISVLVDNAIEAAKEALKSEVFFAIVRQDGRHIIHVKNSMKPSTIPISQIYKQGYSTKGKGRGSGLFNVSQIINRNRHTAIETEITDDFFTQIVYIGDKT